MTIPTEKQAHAAHVALLRELFTSHAYQVISHEALEVLVGRNYQQRVSDLRRAGLHIDNVPVYLADGKRGTGDYRFLPQQLGRDASTRVETTLFDVHRQY